MHGPAQIPIFSPETAPGPLSPGPTRFSLRDTPERERDGLYRELFGRSVMRYEIEPTRQLPFDIDVKLQMMPGLLMVTGTMHGSRNQRTRDWVADGLDDFAMAVNLGGRYVICQDQQEVVLDHGEATLFSMARRCSLMHEPPGGFIAIRVPRSQIVPRIIGADDICMRPIGADTQALRLLINYVGVAQDSPAIAGLELQRLFASHVYDLIALAGGATRDAAQAAQGGGLRAARLHAIKQDIARSLHEPDLSVAAVARRHGCTPRFLQRLFETEGTTFTEYVLTQRLALVRRLLTDPRRAHDKISTIALDAGFADVSYFNRTFRRHFGAAPSEVRAQTRSRSRG